MTDNKEPTLVPAAEVALNGTTNQHQDSPLPAEPVTPVADATSGAENGARRWHAEAGRKGARRVHQLIQEGKLYEREHGLKSGRQRLRQLLELGKLYEEEHGLQPTLGEKRVRRLSRMDRAELLATFLQCLLRIAKPSFRADLLRLVEALQDEKEGHAA